MKRLAILLSCSAVVACVSVSPYEATVNEYNVAYQGVALGMSPDEVNSILSPSQKRLAASERKAPEKYLKDETQVDIMYFRSGWQSDGLSTDDEYTPYIFKDGKLVAIGWQTLGGPSSTGQARDITIQQQSAPVIVY